MFYLKSECCECVAIVKKESFSQPFLNIPVALRLSVQISDCREICHQHKLGLDLSAGKMLSILFFFVFCNHNQSLFDSSFAFN